MNFFLDTCITYTSWEIHTKKIKFSTFNNFLWYYFLYNIFDNYYIKFFLFYMIVDRIKKNYDITSQCEF